MTTYSLPGRFESLTRVSELVKQLGKNAGLSPQAIYEAQSAVDEAFCNIIDHAYGGEGKGDIICSLEVTSLGIEVTLQDHGKPFKPEEIPIPHKPATLKDIKKGGLGLYFMRKMMDEVIFEFSPQQGNILRMIKHKESAG